MWNSMATKSSGQHTPNKLAGHQMMYIGASSGNTRQNIWLVTEYSWEYFWPENIGKGPSARFPRFACQFFRATSFCVMLPFEGQSVTVRYVSISTVLTFHRSRA